MNVLYAGSVPGKPAKPSKVWLLIASNHHLIGSERAMSIQYTSMQENTVRVKFIYTVVDILKIFTSHE